MLNSVSARDKLGQWILASGMDLLCDLEKSHGPYLHDAQTGEDFLDLFSFFASRPLGFNHPKLHEPEFCRRLLRAAQHKPSNCDVYTAEYSEFTDLFARVALGGEFAHVFFVEGGSPAVENAMKAAMDWKHRKNIAAGRGEKGCAILHFEQCFHGRTGYALSVTDSPDQRKTQWFPKFDWPRVPNPYMSYPFDDAAREGVEEREARSREAIEAAFDRYGDDLAAILIEPIQGEGGDNYFRQSFLQYLRDAADAREVLLIFDEVQTGFAATGSWWDWQNSGVKPDLMVFGKKTQVCGFAATARIDEVDGVFITPSRISSTFEGNLVDMVRCQRFIEIIEEDNLLENVQVLGRYLLKVFEDLTEKYHYITNVRGRGTWAAFDLPTPEERDKLLRACFAERLLILPCGHRSIRVRGALDLTADAIGRAGAQLDAGLRRL